MGAVGREELPVELPVELQQLYASVYSGSATAGMAAGPEGSVRETNGLRGEGI